MDTKENFLESIKFSTPWMKLFNMFMDFLRDVGATGFCMRRVNWIKSFLVHLTMKKIDTASTGTLGTTEDGLWKYLTKVAT